MSSNKYYQQNCKNPDFIEKKRIRNKIYYDSVKDNEEIYNHYKDNAKNYYYKNRDKILKNMKIKNSNQPKAPKILSERYLKLKESQKIYYEKNKTKILEKKRLQREELKKIKNSSKADIPMNDVPVKN